MKQKTMLVEAVRASKGRPRALMEAIQRMERFMGAEVTQLINSYHPTDWPHLMAVMRSTVDATLPHLDPSGLQVYEDALHDLRVISYTSEVRLDG